MNKRDLRNPLWILIALPFYAYIPLVNRPPYLWTEGESFKEYLDYFAAQSGLIGGLAIVPPDNLWMRLSDSGILLATSFAAAIPFLIFSIFNKKNGILIPLTLIFFLYYFTMITSNAYIYMLPTVAFGALLISRYKIDYVSRILIYIIALTLIAWNLQHYDIGNNLDKELSATNFYQQVEQLPQDAVVYTGVSGWQRGSIWLYNYTNNTDMKSVSALALSEKDKLIGLQNLQIGLTKGVLYRSVDTNAELKQARLEPWHPSIDEMYEAVRLERG
jgi:hypothetical protein